MTENMTLKSMERVSCHQITCSRKIMFTVARLTIRMLTLYNAKEELNFEHHQKLL